LFSSYNDCGDDLGIGITKVTFGDINNKSGADCNDDPYDYTSYTGLTTTVTQGWTYPISFQQIMLIFHFIGEFGWTGIIQVHLPIILII